MINKTKIASAIATGTILLNAFAPTAFAASTELVIGDNGPQSNSTVNLVQTSTVNVVQNNTANINNTVNSSASTGNNSASFNNGGRVVVDTGNATTTTNVSTTANKNIAEVDGCCARNLNVTVTNNGPLSENTANIVNTNSVNAFQDNVANINNNVDSSAKTGGNAADFNNGGNVTVMTGNATTNTTVRNTANANLLSVGGTGVGAGAGAGLSVRILDNGPLSNNAVNLANLNSVLTVQDNNARINNDVNSRANTGNNTADFNNGGSVVVDTGDARTTTMVDNLVNFNAADVDCGCLLNTTAKVVGNGPLSDNAINASLASLLGVFQTDNAYLNNDVDSKAKTGNSSADFNNAGGSHFGDPAVLTGDATENTNVRNESNWNSVGPSLSLPSPLPGGGSLNLSFSLGALWSWLSLL